MTPALRSSQARAALSRLYTVKVTLIEGPLTEDFAVHNPEISRTIRMNGSSTLSDLHRVITDAFDRTAERTYEFQFERTSPDSDHACYGIPEQCRDMYGVPIHAGDASSTTLDMLCIKTGDRFGYWYDFAEAWLHRIEVLDVSEECVHVEPDVIERVGESPSPSPHGDMFIRS